MAEPAVTSPSADEQKMSDQVASGSQTSPRESTEAGRQGAKRSGSGVAGEPKLLDRNTTTNNLVARRPTSATQAAIEMRTPSIIVEEVQRSQFRDQRRVAKAAIVACGAILIVFIVTMYLIVSGYNHLPPLPPNQNTTTNPVI